MKRTAAVLAVPLLAGSMTLTACGGGNSSTGTSAGSSVGTSASATTAGSVVATSAATTSAAAATSAAGATECPTENTRAFAKTRFVADVGLAAGTFHRWIYKPYKAGTFKQGAQGRNLAIVKAGAVAALDLKLINNAIENVKASPVLCRNLAAPLGELRDSLGGLKDGVTSGDLTTIANVETALSSVMGQSQKQGLVIQETTDEKSLQQ